MGRLGLTLTANAESQVASYIASGVNRRPGTATSAPAPARDNSLSEFIPQLLSAIDEEKDFPEDAIQAQVCLGWIHWALSEPGLAASRLPKDFAQVLRPLLSSGGLSEWTEICIAKGVYFKGTTPSDLGPAVAPIDSSARLVTSSYCE